MVESHGVMGTEVMAIQDQRPNERVINVSNSTALKHDLPNMNSPQASSQVTEVKSDHESSHHGLEKGFIYTSAHVEYVGLMQLIEKYLLLDCDELILTEMQAAIDAKYAKLTREIRATVMSNEDALFLSYYSTNTPLNSSSTHMNTHFVNEIGLPTYNDYQRQKEEFDAALFKVQEASRQKPRTKVSNRRRSVDHEVPTDLLVPEGSETHKKKGSKPSGERPKKKLKVEPSEQVVDEPKTKKRPVKDEASLSADRERMWQTIVRKEMPKNQKNWHVTVSVVHGNRRRLSSLAAKQIRRQYTANSIDPVFLPSPRPNVLQVQRARRAMREMLGFWKKNEKEEKEARKRAEKEQMEKRRAEEEAREARRQARKLNFLISQTELYSHFIANKKNAKIVSDVKMKKDEQATTLQLIEEDGFEEELEHRAKQQAFQAIERQQAATRAFDSNHTRKDENAPSNSNLNDAMTLSNNGMPIDTTPAVTQPSMLKCSLKEYQKKGLGWLANLYDQGINGILADEMGLGKTVQSISLIAHLAERHGIWGPFLVVAPASTLHNWLQELERFVPDLKALPYWGSIADRRSLRRFWSSTGSGSSSATASGLGTKEGPFHVLVTSYQMMVADEKYFIKIPWQYMILDEAQAIKSSSSMRWKTLLTFRCRNRLLLTGTPIQNSMQELWALLHFIMPTLFDSHDEFSEWFAKDIHSHAEHKSRLDEHQLNRLHLILKPFMLRRVKKDVENELADKILKFQGCGLSPKQKYLYALIKSQLKKDLVSIKRKRDKKFITSNLAGTNISNNDASANDTSNFTLPSTLESQLMNLVMQFRKICNHPRLLVGSRVSSAFVFTTGTSPPTDSALGIDCLYGMLSSPITYIVPSSVLDLTTKNMSNLTVTASNTAWDIVLTNSKSECFTKSNSLPLVFDDVFNCGSVLARLFMMVPRVVSSSPSLVTQRSPAPKLALSDVLLYAKNRSEDPHPALSPCIRDYDLRFKNTITDISADIFPHHCIQRPLVQLPLGEDLVKESGKLTALDKLLSSLKRDGHRVLLYFQMTRMMDLMEDYCRYRHHRYLRLDGSTKISDRRDLVHDWQTSESIFLFLLSTRAGGLGINLTAADTVIFYDSDWNPTVDQQAMDRAHRLGQTKQVTVYRLITSGTIEERIMLKAEQKHEIQKVVIAGGNFDNNTVKKKQKIYDDRSDEKVMSQFTDTFEDKMELKSKDIMSLLFDEDTDHE